MAWEFVCDSSDPKSNARSIAAMEERGLSLELRIKQDDKFVYLKGQKALDALKETPSECQFLARDGIDIPAPPPPM